MHITNFSKRQAAIEWGRGLQQLVANRDVQAAASVDQAIEQFTQDRFLLTVLGKAKRGKSTLINALLGRNDDLLAPVDRLPASNAISRFVWADRPAAIAYFRSIDGRTPGAQENIGYEQIRDFVTEEANPGNKRGVDVVEVRGPFPGFDHDLVLVDTPGAGSIHEYHDELLHAFIPQSDAVIFLVTARMPLDQDELELLQKVRAADVQKVVFAVNKVDQASAVDLDAAVAHNAALLAQIGIQVPRIHRISAKKAFEGDLEGSGLDALLCEVREMLHRDKAAYLQDRFVKRIADAVAPVQMGLMTEIESARKSASELAKERESLAEKQRQLEQQRSLSERKFLHDWNGALDAFGEQVGRARQNAKKRRPCRKSCVR